MMMSVCIWGFIFVLLYNNTSDKVTVCLLKRRESQATVCVCVCACAFLTGRSVCVWVYMSVYRGVCVFLYVCVCVWECRLFFS